MGYGKCIVLPSAAIIDGSHVALSASAELFVTSWLSTLLHHINEKITKAYMMLGVIKRNSLCLHLSYCTKVW